MCRLCVRFLWQCWFYGMVLAIIVPCATVLAEDADPQEEAAITEIRKLGGTVRRIATDTEDIEVDFHLGGKDVTDDGLGHVARLKNVTWLNLKETKITDAGLVHLKGLSKLERLHLEKTVVGDPGLVHIAGLENLEYLNLYGTQVGDAGLAHLKGLKKLENLYLWQTEVTDDGVEQLADALPDLNIVRGADLASASGAGGPRQTLVLGKESLPRAGEPWRIAGIRFEDPKAKAPGPKAKANIHYRATGSKKFQTAPLVKGEDDTLEATLPAEVTKEPFEYYIVIREPGQPWASYPLAGKNAPAKITPDATPPALPADPQAVEAKSYHVKLSWTAATDDRGLAEYRVFKGKDQQSAVAADAGSLVGNVAAEALEFLDEKPPAGQTVWYAVQPVDLAGREGAARTVEVAVPEDTPPANSLELSTTAGSKAVILTWKGDTEPDVTELLVFRSDAADGDLAQVAKIEPGAVARWIDNDVKPETTYRYAIKLHDAGGHTSEPTAEVKAAAGLYLRRINCGGEEVASDDGSPWEADKGSVAGTGRFNAKQKVAGVSDELQPVYQTERWSYQRIVYRFEVEPGRYRVTLHFAETNRKFSVAGKRIFDVFLNGEKVHADVDIFASAGADTAWQLPTEVDIAENELIVELRKSKNGPAIKAIEVRALPK